MMYGKSNLYAAFKAKDARFDGRFFAGISSTGIYCRPVCRAKLPKPENCSFYPTAAEAEQAGYRPCLICRPELAPGISITDSGTALAGLAARAMEQAFCSGQGLGGVAARLGFSDRHLRRVFQEQYRVTPVQYLQTCRLLLAKNLLTDTDLSVTGVAMAAGFGSLRRFNDTFKARYNLTPSSIRKQSLSKKKCNGVITLALGYRPPYMWDTLLKFFAGRAITGVEKIKDGKYYRTVSILSPENKRIYGWLCIDNDPIKNVLNVTLSETLLPVLPQVLARLRNQFDLYCEPHTIYETLESMNVIRPGLFVLGTRLPGSFDAFEMSVRAVLGQQISVKAAGTLAARIAGEYGIPVQTGIEGLTRAFPSPEDIIAFGGAIQDKLGKLGVTGARSQTICELAKVLAQRDIGFDIYAQPEREIEKLMAIKGIGNWTAQYIAMRAFAYTNAFLETDAGIKKALAPLSAKEMLTAAENWRPWRSYATISLWNTL